MNFQPPDPSGFGHCVKCHCGIEESEQSGGVCIECQLTAAGSEPAFPVGANEYGGHGTVFGVTVRDYFAARAMKEIDWKAKPLNESADDCYAVADAMLAARMK